jgi:branched-subunit amino acid aminotransferase/4-amino-4-deoxychorismate lyase
VTVLAWINGRFVSGTEGLSPLDQGFLLGLGLFETMTAVADRLPLWDRHLARLKQGAETMGIAFDPPAELQAAASELLRRRGHEGEVLRLTLTAGVEGTPTWCLTTRRRDNVAEPLRLHVSDFHRGDFDPLAGLKSTSHAFYHAAREQARKAGADEALLLDPDGHVLETATGNVFFWREGRWHTPGEGGFLRGIARQVLLEELTAAGSPVEEGNYALAQIRDADAIFVTNAVHGPRAAGLEDGCPSRPGETLAVELKSAWQRALER